MLVTVLNQAFTDVDDFIKAVNGMHATLLAAGWTLLEEIDGADTQQDRVYKSTGESGTEAVYLRATHDGPNDRVNFRAYSWWDPVAGAGYNEVGDILGNTCLQGDDAGMTVWMVVNKDALAVVSEDNAGGVYRRFFSGLMDRQEPSQRSGMTTLQGPADGFNSQNDDRLLVAIGTDFSSFEVDQYLWVVNQDDAGPAVVERVQILGFDAPANTIFLTADLVNNFQAGALVATDPQPLVLWGDSNGTLWDATPKALHSLDDYEETDLEISAAISDGLPNGAVPLFDPLLFGLTSPQYFPGLCPRFKMAPPGLADEDDLEDGTTTYVYFEEDPSPGFALRTS